MVCDPLIFKPFALHSGFFRSLFKPLRSFLGQVAQLEGRNLLSNLLFRAGLATAGAKARILLVCERHD
jgi:hypothetical protein